MASKAPRKTTCKKKARPPTPSPHQKIIFYDYFISSKCKLIYSDRKAICGCLGRVGGRQEGEMTRGLGEHWEVINILTMMMVSGVYRWAKTYQIIHIKYVQFAYCISVILQ